VLVVLSVTVVVTVTVEVTGGKVVLAELVVVLEPPPQSNVPCGSVAREPPATIWSFCRPPPCALPLIPQAVP
jgi:hypothetical protein